MAKHQRKGKFHLSNISGRQKFLRNLDAQREAEQEIREHTLRPLDLSKSDWSDDEEI